MGGKPKPGTAPDKRLGNNNKNAGVAGGKARGAQQQKESGGKKANPFAKK